MAIKADAGKVVWAGGSAGGADHMLAALVVKAAGGNTARLNYVPFSGGGEALAEMLGGRVTAGISGYNEFESQIKTGKLRALAVSSAQRMPGIAVPTLKEQGIETTPFQMWRGVAMPKGAPVDAVAYWQGVLKKVAATKQFKDYISSNVATLHVIVGPDFERFLGEQEAVYKDMLTRLGQMPK